ncbi:hypothetical protein VP01_7648g1, partial [Puccinia sorghi]
RLTNIITGEMHMIGFCPGSDRGKSAGIYVHKKLTPAETALDDENSAKIQSHNMFLAGCMESISRMAYQQNKNLMQEYSIPNWLQYEWVEMKKDDGIDYSFASNEIFGISSYIDKKTGKPIPSPSIQLGHGFLFPQHAYLIDFAKSNGIIEIL